MVGQGYSSHHHNQDKEFWANTGVVRNSYEPQHMELNQQDLLASISHYKLNKSNNSRTQALVKVETLNGKLKVRVNGRIRTEIRARASLELIETRDKVKVTLIGINRTSGVRIYKILKVRTEVNHHETKATGQILETDLTLGLEWLDLLVGLVGIDQIQGLGDLEAWEINHLNHKINLTPHSQGHRFNLIKAGVSQVSLEATNGKGLGGRTIEEGEITGIWGITDQIWEGSLGSQVGSKIIKISLEDLGVKTKKKSKQNLKMMINLNGKGGVPANGTTLRTIRMITLCQKLKHNKTLKML